MVTRMSVYPPLNVRVATPRLELRGATDDLLEALAPLVAAGQATAGPPPWDDPSAFVVVDGEAAGQQDLTGNEFDAFGTVESTSWVSSDLRRRGIGHEMRSAILHLAFDGLGAAEAHSEGALDNAGSNVVSERLGYEPNGVAWATHQAKPVLGQRWRLDRETWRARRRDDITMSGVAECRQALGIEPGART